MQTPATPENPASDQADINTYESLRGKTVFVTGAAQGLGAAICKALAADGVNLVMADLDHDKVSEQANGHACSCLPVRMDAGNEAEVQEALAVAMDRYGQIDAVINNAGIDITMPIAELAVRDWERVVRTNLTGPFIVAKLAADLMRPRGRGHIVNIASTAAKRAWPNAAAYHATKWGLLGLSHALHAELRPHGIKVSAVVAGGMRTPFLLDRFPDIDPTVLQDPAHVARTVRFVLTQPAETVIPEVMVLPMRETSWP